jgi:uncharacterized membrane protein SirB2
MIESYPLIKATHVGLVLASVVLFALRGIAVQLGSPLGMHALVRYSSYTIDTALLTAALLLAFMLHMDPLTHTWLGLKIVLLVVYVVLGSYALKRARTQAARLGFLLAALAVYAWMYGVARAHHPLGWLRWWGWV